MDKALLVIALRRSIQQSMVARAHPGLLYLAIAVGRVLMLGEEEPLV